MFISDRSLPPASSPRLPLDALDHFLVSFSSAPPLLLCFFGILFVGLKAWALNPTHSDACALKGRHWFEPSSLEKAVLTLLVTEPHVGPRTRRQGSDSLWFWRKDSSLGCDEKPFCVLLADGPSWRSSVFRTHTLDVAALCLHLASGLLLSDPFLVSMEPGSSHPASECVSVTSHQLHWTWSDTLWFSLALSLVLTLLWACLPIVKVQFYVAGSGREMLSQQPTSKSHFCFLCVVGSVFVCVLVSLNLCHCSHGNRNTQCWLGTTNQQGLRQCLWVQCFMLYSLSKNESC